MLQRAREIGIREAAQQIYPAPVQASEQRERYLRRHGLRVVQLRPLGFVVRLDDWRIFGQREPEADIGIDVAVGNMVNHLPHRPTVGTIGRVELPVVQARNRLAELGWRLGDRGDVQQPLVGIDRSLGVELAGKLTNRIFEVHWKIIADARLNFGSRSLSMFRVYPASSVFPTLSTARKASCGMSTRPTRFIRFLPSFCFSSSFRLREMSPP